ncbi:MAG: helix-turn-helix domain-containing protein [Actinomycetota bacterium]
MNGRPSQATSPLGPTEHAVLGVLVMHAGRVVSRQNLVRMARIGHLSPRRCDTAIVSLRRMLGSTAIQTVRSRGWMLLLSALDEANKLL